MSYGYKIPPDANQREKDRVRKLRQTGTTAESSASSADLSSLESVYLKLSGANGEQVKIQFDTDAGDPSSQPEGLEWWNTTKKTKNISTGLGPVLQSGLEEWFWGYNNTGSTIDKGSVVHPIDGATDGNPHIELAIADTFEGIDRDIWIATMDIPTGTSGIFTKRGDVNGLDTSSFSVGDNIYVSADIAGSFTNIKPEFPNYAIQVGGIAVSDATEGVLLVDIKGNQYDTFRNFWNGTFRETFDFRVTSSGGVITGTLTPSNGHPDMTMNFSDGFTMIDTDPGATISLTAGTDSIPQVNYVYIPISTKVLTVSTSDWPTTEHIRVAQLYLQSAATVATEGALRNQNINDAIQNTSTHQGHLSHIGQRIRALVAEWDTGVEASLSGTTSNVYISNTAGKVFQMHHQVFPAQDMSTGDKINVVNDSVTPFLLSSDLASDLSLDADGNTLNNRWFSIVIWGACNKTDEPSHLMCNIPTGSYTSEAKAISDADGYSVYDIPKQFKGVGFLIARFTIRKSGTTFTYNSGVGYQDLRGFFPNTTAGSGSGSSGVSTFLELTDTPSTYLADSWMVANSGATALESLERTASNLPIVDSGGIITATDVEAALQENRTAIDSVSLEGLSDISIATKYNKDILGYNTDISKWVNVPKFQSYYYQAFSVENNETSTLTNYQVSVVIDTSTLITAGKLESDGSNMRMLDSNGDVVSFGYIEETWNTTTTEFWIKIPSISGSSTNTYRFAYDSRYWLTKTADLEDVMDFVDEFEGASIDTSKWTDIEGNQVVGSGILNFNAADTATQKMSTIDTFNEDFILTSKFKNIDYSGIKDIGYFLTGSGESSGYVTLNRWSPLTNWQLWNSNAGSTYVDTLASANNQMIELARDATNSRSRFRSNSGTWYNNSSNYYSSALNIRISKNSGSSSNFEIEYVHVRKYTDSEPTVTLGSEFLYDQTPIVTPEESTDNAIVRFSGIDGKTIQDSDVTLDDNGNISKFGGQIKFPATQNASSDVNTLDDYEEGTWTPVLEFGGSSTGITYSTQFGAYIKVGKSVTLTVRIILSSKGTSSGIATITNFPFVNSATQSSNAYMTKVTASGQRQAFMGGTYIYLEDLLAAGTSSGLTDANFTNTSRVYVNAIYIATT